MSELLKALNGRAQAHREATRARREAAPSGGVGTVTAGTVIPAPRRGWLGQAWRFLPVVILAVVLLWAVAPGLFTPYSPVDGVSGGTFQPPSLAHPFGTDHLGRDVFARVVHGASATCLTAGVAVLVGGAIGSIIGVTAAAGGKAADAVGMRAVDMFTALPSVLIALLLATGLGGGIISTGVAVGVGSAVLFARVSRSETLRVRTRDFVEAAMISGAGYWSILRRHILPHVLPMLASLAVIDLGTAILGVSSLGYLGLGSPPPTPEWGLIVAEGRNYLGNAWWMTSLPGTTILVTVVSLGVLGRRASRRGRR